MTFDSFDRAVQEAITLCRRLRCQYIVADLDGRYMVAPRCSFRIPGAAILYTAR